MNSNTLLKLTTWTFCLTAALSSAQAGEIGHYAPGVMNIRDFVVPEPGFYGVLYNYSYTSDRLNDSSGNKINSVTIQPGPGPGVTLNIDVDLDVYALAPTFIWVSPWKILGAKYAAYITPTFGNTSVGASLATEIGSGRSSDESQFAMSDISAGLERVRVSFGVVNPDPAAFAIRTRSLMQILSPLGAGVQISQDLPTHESAVRLDPSLSPSGFKVYSAKEKPTDAFVAVPHEGLWFWIDRRDLPSKTTLAAVTLLFNFLDGGSKASPLLTIPTN